MQNRSLEISSSTTHVEILKLEKTSSSHENKIRQYQAHVEEIHKVTDESDPATLELANIGRKLEGDTKYKGKIEYKIIYHYTTNAFACGSTVYVYSGLLASLKTEGEIAGVLAHEISHIEHGDTWGENDDPRTLGEELSRGRIQEYLADNVSKKLAHSGYNPLAYEGVLAYFAKEQRSVGFTHGASADRQTAYRSQFYLLDHTETATGTNQPKSKNFEESTLDKKQLPSKFEAIERAFGQKNITLAENLIGNLEIWSMLEFLNTIIPKLESTKSTVESKNYKKFFDRKGRVVLNDQFRLDLMALNYSLEIFQRKVGQLLHEQTESEIEQTRTLLLTEVAKKSLYRLEAIADFTKTYVGQEIPDISTKFEQTVNSEENFLTFLENYRGLDSVLSKLNIIDYEVDFPNKLLPTKDSLGINQAFEYRHLIDRLNQNINPNIFDDLENTVIFLQKIGESLNVFESKSKVGKKWVIGEIEDLFIVLVKKLIEKLTIKYESEGSKFEVFKNHQDEISEAVKRFILLASSLLKKCCKSNGDAWLVDKLDRLLFPDNSDYAYSGRSQLERNLKNKIITDVVAEKKKTDEDIKSFIEAFENQEKRLAYFVTLNLKKIKDLLSTSSIKELIPDDVERTTFLEEIFKYILEKYELNEDEVREIYVLSKRRADYQELEGWKSEMDETKNPIEKLNEIGIGKKEMRVLACLDLFRLTSALNSVSKILFSLGPVDKLSPQAQVIILDSNLRINRSSTRTLDSSFVAELRDIVLSRQQNFTLQQSIDFYLKMKSLLKQKYDLDADYGTIEFLQPFVQNVIDRILNLEIDEENPDNWRALYQSVELVFTGDNRTKSQILYVIAEKAIKCMNFEEGHVFLQMLFKKGELPFSAMDLFQENKMGTKLEFTQVSKTAEEMISGLQKYGDGSIGMLAGIDFLSESALEYSFDAHEILEAGLESFQDDTKLRAVLGKVWYDMYSGLQSKFHELGNIDKAMEKSYIAQKFFLPFDKFVEQFYERLTQFDVDVALHKLLLSPKGVLRTWEGKLKVVEILKNEIDRSDPVFQKLLVDIAKAGINSVDPVRIYKPIADVLKNRIFIKPPRVGNNKFAIQKLKDNYPTTLRELVDIPEVRRQRKFVDALFAKSTAVTKKEQYLSKPLVPEETQIKLQNKLKSLVTLPQRTEKREKSPPIDYVLNVAKSMGAVGVRFLQLLGQYIDIPDEYKKKFEDVYDGMKGQLKWTAFKTIEREALSDRATPELKNFYENLADLSPTVGGGSLMTVYVATMKDRNKFIIKVLNPNAEEFIKQNIDDDPPPKFSTQILYN